MSQLAHKHKVYGMEIYLPFYLIAITLLIGLAVFQDYLFSRYQSTGFYISESLLYNTIWIFILPLMNPVLRLHSKWSHHSMGRRGLYALGAASIFSLAHILLFTSFFILVSYWIFSPAHDFTRIWRSAMSQQFYIIFACYAIVPFVHRLIFNPKTKEPSKLSEYASTILLKKADKTMSFSIDEIALITTDKPYTIVFTIDGDKYLDNRSLKYFEKILDPHLFYRVHRSSIVQADSIVELQSRQNGDYDAMLHDGRSVRLSRHYRSNWQALLH